MHLAEAANTVNQALKGGMGITAEMRKKFQQTMAEAKTGLASLPPLPDVTLEVDSEQGATAMQEILEALRENKVVNQDLLNTVVQYLRETVGGDIADKFGKSVHNFKHDAAIALLLDLSAKIRRKTTMNTSECQKTGSVLIIDDQPENIHVLANILQEDYGVQAATNGAKALEIVSGKNPPDVILLDIVMPEMDGYEVCRRLKADEQTRDIPVIFVTVKKSTEDEEYGFNLGAVDYISKPFQPTVVRVRVRNHMNEYTTLLSNP